MADQNDRARSATIITQRGIYDRSNVAVTVNRRRDAAPGEFARERVEPDGNVKDAAQQIEMRSRARSRRIRHNAQIEECKQPEPDPTRLHEFPLPHRRGSRRAPRLLRT